MSGKGSRARPFSVDQKTFDNNWDQIFKNPDPRVVQDSENEDEAFRRIEEQNKLRSNNADKSN
jgi:hypothetical protein